MPPLEPLVMVKPVEREKQGIAPSHASGNDLVAPLLTGGTRGRARDDRMLVDVEGPLWGSFITSVISTTEGRKTSHEWKRRLPSGKYPMRVLFFRAEESPVNSLADRFRHGSPGLLVRFEQENVARYLEVDYRTYSDDDFHFGSGLSTYPHPPRFLLYPYRNLSLWVAVAGLLFYFVLPTAKIPAGALRYARWRVCLGDLVGYVFTLISLALPVFIIGGTVQLFTRGWPLLLFFGALLPFGVFLLYITAWLGSFQVLAEKDDLEVRTFRGTRRFRYADMNFFQPVIFRSPRWLVVLSWIAVIASAGAARIGAAGRALLVSSSAGSSIAIEMKRGATLFISVSDQLGGTALKGFAALLEKLRDEGVKEIRDTREIRSFGLETIRM